MYFSDLGTHIRELISIIFPWKKLKYNKVNWVWLLDDADYGYDDGDGGDGAFHV